MQMNIPLIIAAVITIIIGMIHSVLGEHLIVTPLLKRELPMVGVFDHCPGYLARFEKFRERLKSWSIYKEFFL